MQSPDPSLLVLGSLVGLGLFLSVAHLGEREPVLRIFVWLVLLLGDMAAGLVGLALLAGFTGAAQPGPPVDPLARVVLDNLDWLGALAVAMGAGGLALLLPPVRRLVARLLPIDPSRSVHLVALHLALLVGGVSGMLAVIMTAAAADPAAVQELERELASQGQASLSGLWAQAAGLVILGLLGVGLFVRRGWREALIRLGLTRHFRPLWWAAGTAAGLASGYGIDWLWARFRPESLEVVSQLTDAIFGPYLEAGLLSAVTIGLSAGIGEEIVFRGAAQPRLGLVFTSLLFATMHAQYTVSPALIQVLILALILGLVRRRVNTTTSIAVHASYNFILVVLALYLPDLSP